MSISAALIAFLEALGGSRSGPVDAPVTPPTAPAQGPSPLADIVSGMVVRLADLEAQIKTVRPYVEEEVERARRHVEGLRTTVRRLKDFVEGSELEPDADPNVPSVDAPAGGRTGVLPLHGGMESSNGPSPEEIRAAARRALGQ